jgi:hypothetical protein
MTVATVIYGQDPPVDLDLVVYAGGFWKADINWQDDNGSPVPAINKAMTFRCEKSALVASLLYPPDLNSTLDPAPEINTADYLRLSDGQIEIGLTSETTAALRFSSTLYRIFLLTAGVPELWAQGRIRLVSR